MRKVDLIIDLQYGSTGKGLIAGYLAINNEYDVVVTANMPNAGHTYIDKEGNRIMHKVLPIGVVSPSCQFALIGPGAIFDIKELNREINSLEYLGYSVPMILIHPNAVVTDSRHVKRELHLDKIGSTQQGAGAAMIEKIKRDGTDLTIAKYFAEFILNSTDKKAMVVSIDLYRSILTTADRVLCEGAQGFSLGINQSFWPYCTSRECTPSRYLSDMMVPIPYLDRVIGTVRVHPIRVGGTSGGCYDDQIEITWETIGIEPELTTVTKRKRRIFTFSYKQMDDAIWECCPDAIFLNFVNYDKGKADKIIKKYGTLIKWIGMGASHDDVRERNL